MGRERKFPPHPVIREVSMHNECWGVILAAGQGRRMAEATGGEAKQFLPYQGAPLWWHSARAMAASPLIHGLVFVFPEERLERARQEALELNAKESCGVPLRFAAGGERRQDSVRHALAALPDDCREILALRESAGLSYDEIAAALSLEVGTVKSRLNRARKKLCIALLKSGNFSDRFPSKQGKGCEA